MKTYPHVIVDIFESEMYPVVTHIFYGKSLKEAQGYLKAHMETDSFLRGAMTKGYWKDIRLHYTYKEVSGD